MPWYAYQSEQTHANERIVHEWKRALPQVLVDDAFIQYLRERNARYDVERREVIGRIKTAEQAQDYIRSVRQRMAVVFGALPQSKPTGDRVVRIKQYDGYSIENILIESYPGYFLTANFYKPDGLTAPAPAILFLCGHSPNGKAYPSYLAMCIEAVQNGFCVLCFDPVGQGERFFLTPQDGRFIPGQDPDAVHCHLGHQLSLLGQPLHRYMLWDNVCGMTYLCSRPEVDPARVGVTGSSGGGTATAMLAAVDDRVAAYAPSCYITKFRDLAENCGVQEIEQTPYGMLEAGLDIPDLLHAAAPKPCMVCGTLYDFFPIEGFRDATREAHLLYRALGKQDQLAVHIEAAPHSMPRATRESVLNFFAHHLAHDRPIALPQDGVELPEEADLYAAPQGDARKVNQISLLQLARQHAAQLGGKTAFTAAGLAARLGLKGEYVPQNIRCVDQFITFESQPNMPIQAEYTPGTQNDLVVVIGERSAGQVECGCHGGDACGCHDGCGHDHGCDGCGHDHGHDCAGGCDGCSGCGESSCGRQYVVDGPAVLLAEPRGCGQSAASVDAFSLNDEGHYLNLEHALAWNVHLFGESLLGMRVGDAIAAAHIGRMLCGGRVVLRGAGRYALIALMAGLFADVDAVEVDQLLTGYNAILQGDYAYNLADMPYGMLALGDIDDVIRAVEARGVKVTVNSRVDAMMQPV